MLDEKADSYIIFAGSNLFAVYLTQVVSIPRNYEILAAFQLLFICIPGPTVILLTEDFFPKAFPNGLLWMVKPYKQHNLNKSGHNKWKIKETELFK